MSGGQPPALQQGFGPQPSDEPLELVRQDVTPDGLLSAFSRNELEPSHWGVILRECQVQNFAPVWGYKNLGRFAKERLNLRQATFAKYKDAGRVLEEVFPHLYARCLRALVDQRAVPDLPKASKVVNLPGAQRGRTAQEFGTISAAILSPYMSSPKLRRVDNSIRYGELEPESRVKLIKLEELVDGLGDALVGLMDLVGEADTRPVLKQTLHGLLPRLLGHVQTLGEVVRDSQSVLGPPPSPSPTAGPVPPPTPPRAPLAPTSAEKPSTGVPDASKGK